METKESLTHQGRCRCGAVAFEVEGNAYFSVICHCLICRQCTSSPLSFVVGVPKNAFRFVQGEDNCRRYRASPILDVVFCSLCGGHLFQENLTMPFYSTFATVYDGNRSKNPIASHDPWFRPTMHVNYENRVFDMKDDLPKYMEFPLIIGGSGVIFDQTEKQ
jgi:hypothetical protein